MNEYTDERNFRNLDPVLADECEKNKLNARKFCGSFLKYSVVIAFCLIHITCSLPGFIKPDPRYSQNASVKIVDDSLSNISVFDSSRFQDTSEIDFGELVDSLVDTLNFADVFDSIAVPPLNKTYLVKTEMVRVALIQNAHSVALSSGSLMISGSVMSPNCSRVIFQVSKKFRANYVTAVSDKWTKEIWLPCTLVTESPSSCIKVNNNSYRGSLIIACDESGLLQVVNYLPVEEYLRGVVPLEIGKRPEMVIEALKAQAVAARTYAYKKIQERTSFRYDMTNTVADQVYGGINVEDSVADLAIALTKNLILVCNDEIITAYYHSTCGGQTASIEQVWDKPACSYLVSVSDLDSLGQPYCTSSPAFSWQEKWTKAQLNDELIKALKKTYPQKTFSGTVKNITIDERLPCGRVKACTIKGGHWSVQCGGDKIRFLFRRSIVGAPILRSANFKVSSYGAHEVVFQGFGYGHGVGMCQTGALGRALDGQTFDKILKAYYTGVSICTVSSKCGL